MDVLEGFHPDLPRLRQPGEGFLPRIVKGLPSAKVVVGRVAAPQEGESGVDVLLCLFGGNRLRGRFRGGGEGFQLLVGVLLVKAGVLVQPVVFDDRDGSVINREPVFRNRLQEARVFCLAGVQAPLPPRGGTGKRVQWMPAPAAAAPESRR